MTPKLTQEQRDALDQCDGPIRVVDELTKRTYFLIDESTFQSLHDQEELLAIRQGIADMEAGKVVALDELDARIRLRLGLPLQQ